MGGMKLHGACSLVSRPGRELTAQVPCMPAHSCVCLWYVSVYAGLELQRGVVRAE